MTLDKNTEQYTNKILPFQMPIEQRLGLYVYQTNILDPV